MFEHFEAKKPAKYPQFPNDARSADIYILIKIDRSLPAAEQLFLTIHKLCMTIGAGSSLLGSQTRPQWMRSD